MEIVYVGLKKEVAIGLQWFDPITSTADKTALHMKDPNVQEEATQEVTAPETASEETASAETAIAEDAEGYQTSDKSEGGVN